MSPHSSRLSHGALVVLLGCGLVAATSGCSSLPSAASLPLSGSTKNASDPGSAAGVCTVEFHSSTRRTKSVEIPVTPNTRVQDALQASKAIKRFRNPEVVVVRPTQHPSEPHLKLNCRFDRKDRRVAWDTDYSVMPGDRILIREAKGTGVEDAIGSMVGPILSGK